MEKPRDYEAAVSGHLSFKPPTLPPNHHPQDDKTTVAKSMRLAGVSAMDAYSRHRKFVNDYLRYYGKAEDFKPKDAKHVTDYDILKQEHRFLRNPEDDDDSYEKRMAKKYYDKLFKEYALADLRLYKEGKIGLRWRTEKEVIDGKGQFVCGSKHCEERAHLRSYEVNFGYVEAGQKKNALVKLRLCPPCAEKLNYKEKKAKEDRKEEAKRLKLAEERAPALLMPPAAEKEEKEEGKDTQTPAQLPPPAAVGLTEEERKKKEEEEAALAREQQAAIEKEQARLALAEKEANAWKERPSLERTKEEEFDEYFRGLFP